MAMTREDWCHVAYAVIGLCVVSPLCILATDSRPCITIERSELSPTEVLPGEIITMTYDAVEHMPCGGFIVRRFLGSDKVYRETIREPTIYHEVLDRDRHSFSTYVTVPLLPPGISVYAPVVYRWRNPIQKWWPIRDMSVPRLPFEVKKVAAAAQGEKGDKGDKGDRGSPP